MYILWVCGVAALGVIAATTGLVLAAKRRREEEEERQAAEVRAQAEAKTEALRGQKEHQRLLERIQNSLLSQQMKKAQEAAARQAQHRAMDAKIEREEQKEEAAWEAWKSRSQTLAAQRAEQQRQQAAAAYQAYRQGERAEPPKTPTPTPTPTSVKTPVPAPAPPMPQGTSTPTATPTTPVKPPQPDQLPPPPVPACTMPPTPQVFIGPAPTKQPTPTPVPPLTGQDVARGICEAADLVDPVIPDPATVGGPDVGDLIDQAYIWQQSVPRISPEFEIVVRTPIMIVKAFKDGPSTTVNFVCQQKDKSGPYYEMFPIDQKVQGVKDWWNGMNTKQKVFVVGFTVLALLIATPLIVSLVG